MKRLLSFALVLVTTLAAAGCGDITNPADSVSGTWSMQTLGGQRLPASLYYANASDHIEIINGYITVYSDGRYTDVTRVQDTNYGPTTVFDDQTQGTWQLSGSRITLVDSYDGHVTVGYVDNGRLAIDNFGGFGMTAEYLR